jgi:putative transposase
VRPRRGQSPPGHSFNLTGEKVSDETITTCLKHYREDKFLKYEGDSKLLSKYLRRDYGFVVNHKKVARLCKAHGLQLKTRRKKISKFVKIAQNHIITQPHQLWEFDIKYGYLHGEKRFFFLLAFIDVYNREIVNWYLGYRCQAQDVYRTLKIALETKNILNEDRLIIRSDNGPQMRANLLKQQLLNLPLEHEFIPFSSPNKNAHIESFFSIYDKQMQEQYFWNLADAYHWTTEYINFYNNDRIHGSLGMSPRDFTKNLDYRNQEKFIVAI